MVRLITSLESIQRAIPLVAKLQEEQKQNESWMWKEGSGEV